MRGGLCSLTPRAWKSISRARRKSGAFSRCSQITCYDAQFHAGAMPPIHALGLFRSDCQEISRYLGLRSMLGSFIVHSIVARQRLS